MAIRALFEQALKIDPDDPEALGGDAATYLNEKLFGWANPETDYEAKVLGQADRAIALETLALAGVPDPRSQVDAFQRVLARVVPEVADVVREHGRVLPGAAEAIRAVAAAGDGRVLVQSVLTGNMRVMARVKLGALGLDRDLDLEVGAYGDAHEIRADLVPLARASAAAAYGADFSGPATVLVGDTPLDVEAARVAGARAVGVQAQGTWVRDSRWPGPAWRDWSRAGAFGL